MRRRPPRSTRTDTLFPYTTLFRSLLRGLPPFGACSMGHGWALEGGELFAPHEVQRSEEHTSELQSLMRISYAVFCSHKTNVCTNLHLHERVPALSRYPMTYHDELIARAPVPAGPTPPTLSLK